MRTQFNDKLLAKRSFPNGKWWYYSGTPANLDNENKDLKEVIVKPGSP